MKGSIMLAHPEDLTMNTHSSKTLNDAFERLGYHFNKKQNKRRRPAQKTAAIEMH